MRHHGFSCSSLYTVTPEQAQENLLIKQLIKDGYSVIGVSTFNGAFTEQNKAINQAKEVGAQILLIGYKHTGSRQKIVPQTEYHPSQTATVQSYGSSNGNVNGYGGSASGHVSGQSTTYITLPGYTTTEYVPVTIERYDHLAIYLRKRK